MDNNQPQTSMNQEQMLAEILENSRKTKNYIKWQLVITIAFVVIPLIAIFAIVPYAISSLGSMYGLGGDTSSLNLETLKTDQLRELLQ